MGNDPPRIYMDSCCFIDYAKGECLGKNSSILPQRMVALRGLLRKAETGKIDIYSSAITIAECLHLGDGTITEEAKRLFESILTSGQIVKPVQAHIFIMEDARNLRWNHGINLSGADGIHVASALYAKCTEFITNDKGIGKLKNTAILNQLGLKVITAEQSTSVSAMYRQPLA